MPHLRATPLAALALTLTLGAAPAARALDRDEARGRLKEARERYDEMIDLREVYYSKKNLAGQVNQGLEVRRELDAVVRKLHAVVDGLPARRTNEQQQIYQQWLQARTNLAEIDRQIEECRAQMRAIDEAALARAEALGRRPQVVGRFDILAVFPDVERRCGAAFDHLRAAVADVGGPQEVDRLLRELNGDLNRSGDGDARFGPPAPFLNDFRNYKRASPVRSQPRNRKVARR